MSRLPLPVVFTTKAAGQLQEAVAWWIVNRPAAPNVLIAEVARAVGLIALQPAMGVVARSSRLRGVRRVLLEPMGYHIYYRVRPLLQRIDILAVWHASRGSDPKL